MLLAIAAVTAIFAVEAANVVQVSVLHRHGARQEPVEVNGAMSWSNADLTVAGVEMSLQMGKALQLRYALMLNDTTDDAILSQSTDISRTIRSGFGVRAGMSNAGTDSMPFLSHISPMMDDFMLAFSSNFPSFPVASAYWSSFRNRNDVARGLLGSEGIKVLVDEFGEWCSNTTMECALLAEDAAQCRISNGGISMGLLKLFPQLQILQMMNNKFYFGRNASSPFFARGSAGYVLGAKFLKDASEVGRASTKLFHYSAHDNTVVGLLSALGAIDLDDTNVQLWVPRFMQTIIMEVYADGTVALLQGRPSNYSAGSSFSFISFTPLNMSCVLSSGSVVRSPLCQVGELQRYLDTMSAPTDPLIVAGSLSAECWLPQAFSALCPNDNLSPECSAYRLRCPQSCTVDDPSSVMSTSTGFCEGFLLPKFGSSSAVAISSAVAAIVGGFVIGRLIYLLVMFEEIKHPEEKSYMEHMEDDVQ